MNKVSNLKKGGIICLSFLLLGSFASSELTYDPETGTYINETASETQNDIWIPVEESEETTPEVVDADTQAIIDQMVQQQEASTSAGESVDAGVEVIEVVEVVENATYTHAQLNTLESKLATTVDALAVYLDSQASQLAGLYNTHISNKYGSAFAEVVLCLGDDNAVTQIQHDIQDIIDSLNTRSKTDAADLYTHIASIGYRYDVGLLDDVSLTIESNALEGSIAAFDTQFRSLVDQYVAEARTEITSFVTTQEADQYDELLQVYIARRSKLDQLKQAFTAFENGSFFSQTVVGPRADDLESLADDVFAIFRNDMLGQWGNRSPQAFDAMIGSLKLQYDAKVEETIEQLFPYGNIEGLYNSYTLLAGIYGIDNDSYACQAVINNDAVDTAGPVLMSKIESVQQEMAVAMSAVGGATSWLELQEGLSDILLDFYQTDLRTQFQSAYATAQTIVLSEAEQMYNDYRAQVITFLLGMRGTYVANDNLVGFEARLERAYERVESAIADGAEGRLLLILQAIGGAIQEVL